MKLRQVRVAAAGLAAYASLFSLDAMAYKSDVHQDIPDAAWELMLATQDPALHTGRGLFVDQPAPPTSLREPPTGVDPVAWNQFLEDIRSAILKLNRMPAGVAASSVPACNDLGPGVTMGRITTRIRSDYVGEDNIFSGDDNGPGFLGLNFCERKNNHRRGIYARVGSEPGRPRVCSDADPHTCEDPVQGAVCPANNGVCVDFGGLQGEFGETIAQGLLLGWHAKAGDDCLQDINLDTNLVLAVINWPLPWLGGNSINDVGSVIGFGLAIVFAPLLCISAAVNDQSCLDTVLRASRDLNPAAAFAGLIPPLDTDTEDRIFGGLPHFINAQGANALGLQTSDTYGFQNEFDDRRGMWYAWAGPNYFPGVIDRVITEAMELGGQVIDPDDSRMVERYDLGGVGDGHPESLPPRSRWRWNRQSLGHTPLTPSDNFAWFGWSRFESDSTNPTRNVKYLRWPLHALGDASVPMHVAATTGYGHVPYEQVVSDFRTDLRDFAGDWYIGQLDPELDQWVQARSILKEAFDVRQTILAYRQQRGLPHGIPIRDLITDLAKETLEDANEDGGWAWCDTCSVGWQVFGETDTSKIHYSSPENLTRALDLFERSIAYTFAFLLSASEVPILTPSCVEPGQACTSSGECCLGSCSGGVCGNAAPTGPGTCNSSNPCPHGQPCINGYCQGCTDCTRDEHCPGNRCVNGCCETGACGTTDPNCTGVCPTVDCAGGMCDLATGTCCTQDFQYCDAQTDCCSGFCIVEPGATSGMCARTGALGTACHLDSDCAPVGICLSGTCQCGAGGASCTMGTECCSQTCDANGACTPNGDPGDPCRFTTDCRTGSCVAINGCGGTCAGDQDCQSNPGSVCTGGRCCFDPRCANVCQGENDCPNSSQGCVSGTCCRQDNATCTTYTDCCSRNCDASGRCRPAVVR